MARREPVRGRMRHTYAFLRTWLSGNPFRDIPILVHDARETRRRTLSRTVFDTAFLELAGKRRGKRTLRAERRRARRDERMREYGY